MPNRTDPARAPYPADIENYSISNWVVTTPAPPPIQDGTPRPLNSGDITHPASLNLEQVQTISKPYKNRFRELSSCLTVFGNGSNDSAPGALIASIEK